MQFFKEQFLIFKAQMGQIQIDWPAGLQNGQSAFRIGSFFFCSSRLHDSRPYHDGSIPCRRPSHRAPASPDRGAQYPSLPCERDPDLSYRVNVQGTANVIAVAKAYNIRLIFLSSDLVFDGEKDGPYHEGDPVSPATVYGWHKVTVEEMISQELTNYLVIRTGVMA